MAPADRPPVQWGETALHPGHPRVGGQAVLHEMEGAAGPQHPVGLGERPSPGSGIVHSVQVLSTKSAHKPPATGIAWASVPTNSTGTAWAAIRVAANRRPTVAGSTARTLVTPSG